MSDKKEEKHRKNFDSESAEEEMLLRNDKGKPLEVISLDVGEEGEEAREIDEETALELLRQAQEKAYGEELAEYTDDLEIQAALATRQALNTGRKKLGDRLAEHHAESPELAAGDVDAAWDAADVGEETVGGTAPTPDQDVVEELGKALGITYEDDEPLHTEEKLMERDRHRWELDPRAADEVEDE
jgi:hypothetical protein